MRSPGPGLPIEDHAVVGDTRTMALVAADGSVDWLCLPRFDSAACFAALLGDERHGRWQLCPDVPVRRTRRRYRPGTLVLETEWETDDGVVRVVDAMPLQDGHAVLLRRVEGVAGEVPMVLRWTVRFAYGAAVPWVRRDGDQLLAVAGPDAVVLRGDLLPEPDPRSASSSHVARFRVRAGEAVGFSLAWFPSHEPVPPAHQVAEALAGTEEAWRAWSSRSTYRGRYGEAVQRSLLTLKALTFAPTGGMVAAATTSLPERPGGSRNWDYRFCWLRDATLVLLVLLSAGYTDEARAWTQWLLRAVAGSPEQLQIVYGVAGERYLPELELGWLPGHRGSGPVRIGNAAGQQFQLDVYGEVVSALHAARSAGLVDGIAWEVEKALLGQLVQVLDQPDDGLWEVRGERRRFTHSRVMVWVALDRAVRDVEEHGLDGDVDTWRALRDRVHEEVCREGWSESAGSFVQHYGGDQLDAALLVLASVGFLPADDPRFVATVDAVCARLRHGPLVDRYESGSDVDGLPEGEGSFLACSFWLVTALVQVGREDEARALFEELLALRNDVGLLAEEHDGTRMLGNFPQAFSHLALVDAASALEGEGVSAPSGGGHGAP